MAARDLSDLPFGTLKEEHVLTRQPQRGYRDALFQDGRATSVGETTMLGFPRVLEVLVGQRRELVRVAQDDAGAGIVGQHARAVLSEGQRVTQRLTGQRQGGG